MNRFAKNLKERLLNNAILLKPFDMVEELKMAQLQLIKRNQKPFDSIKLKTICKDLNVICDENVLFRCEGRLKNCTSPYDDSTSLIKSYRRLVSRRGCPSVTISDNSRNFVSNETVEFVNGLGVNWRFNMLLAPWHGGFFERYVRSTKTLLRKTLQTAKLTCEELQTALYEVEQIINNRPIAYTFIPTTNNRV